MSRRHNKGQRQRPPLSHPPRPSGGAGSGGGGGVQPRTPGADRLSAAYRQHQALLLDLEEGHHQGPPPTVSLPTPQEGWPADDGESTTFATTLPVIPPPTIPLSSPPPSPQDLRRALTVYADVRIAVGSQLALLSDVLKGIQSVVLELESVEGFEGATVRGLMQVRHQLILGYDGLVGELQRLSPSNPLGG